MSASKQHYNPKSRRDSFKKKQKNKEEFQRKESKNRQNEENKSKKENKKNSKKLSKKTVKQKPDVYEIMNFSSYKDIGFRIPIKFTLTGKLKPESRKMIYNFLSKNKDIVVDNINCLKYISLTPYICLKLEADREYEFKIKHFLDICCKRSNLKRSLKEKKELYYLDIYKRDYYLCFNLSSIFEKLREYSVINNKELINYIELKTHIYDKIDLTKYKFKNSLIKSCGARAEFFNMTFKDTCYRVTNSMAVAEFTKMIPCVYRFYFKSSGTIDVNEKSRFLLKNRNINHCQKIVETPPTSARLYAIPNILRYC